MDRRNFAFYGEITRKETECWIRSGVSGSLPRIFHTQVIAQRHKSSLRKKTGIQAAGGFAAGSRFLSQMAARIISISIPKTGGDYF